jgi:IS5 family transposase
MALSAANLSEVTALLPLVDAIPFVRGPMGRPRRRSKKLHADKGYESRANREGLRNRHIIPHIARKGIESSERLGRYRWIVEQRLAVLHQLRRLRVRDERRDDIHFVLLVLGCDLMLFRSLAGFC